MALAGGASGWRQPAACCRCCDTSVCLISVEEQQTLRCRCLDVLPLCLWLQPLTTSSSSSSSLRWLPGLRWESCRWKVFLFFFFKIDHSTLSVATRASAPPPRPPHNTFGWCSPSRVGSVCPRVMAAVEAAQWEGPRQQ